MEKLKSSVRQRSRGRCRLTISGTKEGGVRGSETKTKRGREDCHTLLVGGWWHWHLLLKNRRRQRKRLGEDLAGVFLDKQALALQEGAQPLLVLLNSHFQLQVVHILKPLALPEIRVIPEATKGVVQGRDGGKKCSSLGIERAGGGQGSRVGTLDGLLLAKRRNRGDAGVGGCWGSGASELFSSEHVLRWEGVHDCRQGCWWGD